MEKLLGMVQKQFFLLKGVGLATQELTDEYDNVIETVEKEREVTWADQNTTDCCSSEKSSLQSLAAAAVSPSLPSFLTWKRMQEILSIHSALASQPTG